MLHCLLSVVRLLYVCMLYCTCSSVYVLCCWLSLSPLLMMIRTHILAFSLWTFCPSRSSCLICLVFVYLRNFTIILVFYFDWKCTVILYLSITLSSCLYVKVEQSNVSLSLSIFYISLLLSWQTNALDFTTVLWLNDGHTSSLCCSLLAICL